MLSKMIVVSTFAVLFAWTSLAILVSTDMLSLDLAGNGLSSEFANKRSSAILNCIILALCPMTVFWWLWAILRMLRARVVEKLKSGQDTS